jgi:hypothetical protein
VVHLAERNRPRAVRRLRAIRGAFWLFAAVVISLFARFAAAELASESRAEPAKPLHERVDALVEAAQFGPIAGQSSDAEFLRRVYLDIVGKIPTSVEARAFFDDPAADKRAKLIDRLLASPEHARHLATTFDVMLMERRPAKGVADAEWKKFLFDSIRTNKPYDQLVREMLTADGSDPATRPAANFMLARDAEPNLATRDIARVFFGRDLQCCQCHDHPLVDDFYQAEYYGIYSLVGRTSVFADAKDNGKLYLAEKAEGDPTYVSVFDKAKISRTGEPRVPLGERIADPAIPKGEEYTVKPDKDVRPIPKHSRRAELAKAATENNPAFRRNIVNRVWAMLFGQGLVDPVDMLHRGNAPANEAVLDLLADEFAAHRYDLRWLIGELAKSRTYQRSIDLPGELAAAAGQLAEQIKVDEAEREKLVTVAVASKEAMTQAETAMDAAKGELIAIHAELAKQQSAATALKKPADDAAAALTAAEKDFSAKEDAGMSLAPAAAKAAEAAEKLKDQKDVVDAAAMLKAANERQIAIVAAARAIVEEKKLAAKAAADAFASANALVAAQADMAAKSTARVEALYAMFREATAKWQADDAAADRIGRRAADEKALVSYAQADAQIAAAQAEYAKAEINLAVAKTNADASAAKLAAMTATNAETQKVLEAATSTQNQVETVIAQLQINATAVAEAFAKTDAAHKLLPDDADLVEAAAKLKTKSEQAAAIVVAELPKLVAAQAETKVATDRHAQVTAAMQAAEQESAAMTKSMTDATTRVATAAASRDALVQSRADLERDLATRFSRRLAVGSIRALAPEQLAWSMMQASGVLTNHRAAEINAWNQANPAADEAAANAPERIATRDIAVEQKNYDQLVGNVGPFIPLFAAAAGQPQDDFYATADQALFFANGGHVRGWLNPGGENLAARLDKLKESRPLAEELYLSVLTRKPTDAEVSDVETYLAARPNDRAAAIQELAWSLMTSAEFRFNH